MMAAAAPATPAAEEFPAGLHLLADVSLLVEGVFRRRENPAARESKILGKLIRDVKNMDFVKMSASTMPWFPRKRKMPSPEKAHYYSHPPLEPIQEDFQEEEEEQVQIKKRRKKKNNSRAAGQGYGIRAVHQEAPAAPRDMPDEFKKKIRELAGPDAMITEEKFLIEKTLTESDTNKHQGRLTMPERGMAEREFLTEEEKRLVRQKVGIRWEPVDVTLVDPLLRGWRVELRRWVMEKGEGKRSSVLYVVNGGWKDVLEGMNWDGKKGLGIPIRVWSVRVNGHLWLAVVKV